MKEFKYSLRQEVWFIDKGIIDSFVIGTCILSCNHYHEFDKMYSPMDTTKPWKFLEEELYPSEKELLEQIIFDLQKRL